MTPAFTTRRRADDFDRLVEAARQGSPAPGPVPAELAELAALATSLREVPAVAPRPAFSAHLRERLMLAAASELTSPSSVEDRLTVRHDPATRRRHERRLTAGIATLAIVGASAGTALASQGALPGEPLYPVKRAIENVRAGFTTTDSAKGAALLADAGNRLREASRLARGSSAPDSGELTATLTAFADQATKASDLLLSTYQQHQDAGSIQKLHRFAADSIDQLTALEPLLPDGAKQALTAAARTVLMIDTAAHNVCPSCGGNPITSLPESLLSPVSTTLDSHPAQPKAPASAGTTRIKLPTVPTTLGPANVEPTTVPTAVPTTSAATGTTGTTDPTKGGTDPIKKVLPQPSSTPTTLGQVLGGVTDGVTGTVDGVLGTVNGVTNGLLGGGKSTAP